MRYLRIWILGMLFAAAAGALLWWPRPPRLPILRLVNPAGKQVGGAKFAELRNETGGAWWCHIGTRASLLDAGQRHVFRVPGFSFDDTGTTIKVTVIRDASGLTGWRRAMPRWFLRLMPRPKIESAVLSVFVPPDFNPEPFLQRSRAARNPFDGQMKLRTNGWEREPDPPAAQSPTERTKSQ